MSVQTFSFSIFGQSFKNDQSGDASGQKQQSEDNLPKSKVAPDLQESVDNLSNGFRADETQKVIIQLKSATEINQRF